jgi:peptide/nickel transport system substrate-binding protein
MKRALIALLLVLLAGGILFANAPAPEPAEKPMAAPMAPEIKNPDTFINATIGTITTFDPAICYDTSSAAVQGAIYEKLVYYDRGTPNLVGVLAEQVPSLANGLISPDGKTYRFKIRKGVTFHEGGTLTPADVEYSIERVMILDVDGGPQWMYWMVFFDDYTGFNDDGTFKYTYDEISSKVETDGDYVVFHLANPSPFFLAILAGSWGNIVDKEWMIANGAWDGTEADRARVSNPLTGEEFLNEIANGTGPYKLERWVKGEEVVHVRNESYWGPAPALKYGIWKVVPEWSTRRLMLLQGDVDMADVQAPYYLDMEKEAGLTVQKDLPSLSVTGIEFQLDINTDDNPYTGSGKLDGQGVPSDFFADLNVRQAFMHAFDEETWLRDIGLGFRIDPVTWMPNGLPFKDNSVERPAYDLNIAEDYFKKAFDGQVWEKGFFLVMAYNEGNEERGAAMRILAENIAQINPKFQIDVKSVPWAEHLELRKNNRYSLFSIGWAPDYPDADNYADPFMSSWGYFAGQGGYANDEVDAAILKARSSLDPAERQELYSWLQQKYIDDAIGIIFSQGQVRRYYRDWLKFDGGFFYQPNDADSYNLLKYMSKE